MNLQNAAKRKLKKKKIHPGFNNPAVPYAISHHMTEDQADKVLARKKKS